MTHPELSEYDLRAGAYRQGGAMTVAEAKEVYVPFGKYRGRKLGPIAGEDPKYFDWLAGLDDIENNQFREAIEVLSKDPDIADSVERAVGDE